MPFIYETFAQRKISAEANAMTEYVLGLRGIVPNYGSQFLLQSVGTILKVGTGMLVFTGRKGINTELLEIDVVPEALGTKTKYIIATLDGTQQPTFASASITVSDTSEGSITSKTEDLMANVQGIVKFDLGTFTNTTSGIDSNSLTITCPIIDQEIIDNIKDDIFDIQGDLSSVITKVDGLSGAARNILKGTSDMSGTLKPQFVTTDKYLGLTISRATAPVTGDTDTVKFKSAILCNETEYICSFYARSSVANTVVRNYFYAPNTTIYSESSTGQTSGTGTGDGSIGVTLSTTMERYWIKWRQTPANSTKDIIIGRPLAGSGVTVEVCGIALYEGNLTKDWSPAPEDSYGLEIGARNILRGTANPILTTSSTEGTWANGKFYINQTGGTIESVPVTNSPTPSVNKGIKLTRTTTGRLYLIQKNVYLEKGQYTASFWVDGTEGAVIKVLEAWTANSAENVSAGQIFTLQQGWNRFQVTRNVLSSENKSIFRLELFSEVIGEEVTILAPQVERSNIASDWRPAPEDIIYDRSSKLPAPWGGMIGGRSDVKFKLNTQLNGATNLGEIQVSEGTVIEFPNGTTSNFPIDSIALNGEVSTSYGEGFKGKFYIAYTAQDKTDRFTSLSYSLTTEVSTSQNLMLIRYNGLSWETFDNNNVSETFSPLSTDCILAEVEAFETTGGLSRLEYFITHTDNAIPHTRSKLISSATYAVGAEIPFDLSPWDTIEASSLTNLIVRLVKSRDGTAFRGSVIYFDGSNNQVTFGVEIQLNGSSKWILTNSSILTHYPPPATSWHSAKSNLTIRNIYGISYR